MGNLLNEHIDYKIERTGFGVWRHYLYESGARFSEFRSHQELLNWPLLHYIHGISPETGRRVVAKGVIAVERLAMGGVAIGHASFGIVAIGQLGLGILFGLAQLSTGYWAIGQAALGVEFGLGQLATGETAIGQLAFGDYVLAQVGWGEHVWAEGQQDPEAVSYFQDLWQRVKLFWEAV
ncbi:hypothetical protein [Candidatus Reidiella endopervernicosa]|uniref:Uncharacterized protein n=1 Tax=Candidatus Reidiella endopervernicosa TaxID=2738883 RepID=A0A6N0HYT3_9GAMM|nr:hypothetical protein [Candidatus Reidiella endopervernicosa]QKQ27411.1 hypothetical protein HUE57_14820 [Candidatus Reidiella endopervernicosa]